MTKKSTEEFEQFDNAIKAILRADPKTVKSAVDEGIGTHTAERKAKGERKRGRKPKVTSASVHASASEH